VVLSGREIPAATGEAEADVRAALAALMVARASRFGRAPVAEDADVAETLLGYRPEGIPGDVVGRLEEVRRRMLPGISHSPKRARRLVAALVPESLAGPPGEIRERLAGGEIPFVR
jgi:hypothetical protein